MSYVVLARKWRPQSFEDVIGQPHVVQTLRNAISEQRIAHAYLFSGARGVGKTSVARILAKALNCARGPSPIPCNDCESCEEITASRSLDVLEIDGASNRGINEIRELRDNVRYLPSRSTYKIYIIDEVHMLTGEAFNALLKTLEEPPAHVIFIFATTEPHRIPITIISRCQGFDFRRLSSAAIVDHLRHMAAEEGIDISEASLRVLAREAEGSMRDAQSLLEQVLAFSGKKISNQDLLEVLGIVDRRAVAEVAAALLGGDARRCLEMVENLYSYGHDLRRFCQELAAHFRNLLVLKLSSEPRHLVELTDAELSELETQAKESSSATLQQFFHLLMRAEEEIRRSSNQKLVLEMTLLRLVQLPRVMDIDQIIGHVEQLEERLAAGPPSSASSSGSASRNCCSETEAAVPDYSQETHSHEEKAASRGVAEPGPDTWAGLLERVRQEKPLLAASLKEANVREVSPGSLELDFNGREFDYELAKERENLGLLQALGKELGGERFKITLHAGGPQARQERRAQNHRQRSLQQKALKHPLVAEALEIFGGEIVEVRVGPEKSH